MAITYAHNIPFEAVADVDINGFLRTNLVRQGDDEVTTTKTSTTVKSHYVVQSGDRTLPTDVYVRCTKNLPVGAGDIGKSSYSISIETTMRVLDGTVELAAKPASFTLSWVLPGTTIYEDAVIHNILQALASLMWSSVVAGDPADGNMTKLAYGNVGLF